jgi:hypothetical protein
MEVMRRRGDYFLSGRILFLYKCDRIPSDNWLHSSQAIKMFQNMSSALRRMTLMRVFFMRNQRGNHR